MADEPATPQTGGRLADLIGTVLLLIAHLLLYGATFSMLALIVMGTDSCAYQKCGE